ncbi:MAG: hypothetical protein QNJ60_12660 [Xenococcaceae cyanobacterium MO_188.B19]|nr:hypothetical protein [Xenococcaceae cyanobacterium MO_188.B19]
MIPQVLKGIIDNRKHRQQDIIHPNAKGQGILANHVAKALQPLLKKANNPIGVGNQTFLHFQKLKGNT